MFWFGLAIIISELGYSSILYHKWPRISLFFAQRNTQLFSRATVGIFDCICAVIHIDCSAQRTAEQRLPCYHHLQLRRSKINLHVLGLRASADGESQFHLFVILRPRVTVALALSEAVPSVRAGARTGGNGSGVLIHQARQRPQTAATAGTARAPAPALPSCHVAPFRPRVGVLYREIDSFPYVLDFVVDASAHEGIAADSSRRCCADRSCARGWYAGYVVSASH
mmetsp:Transcript_38365/g.81877  ORF Transcript_38365/g.81877 Transcript_38365/m.81877 type:complete len:225 (+) Transcript_38365:1255-1929(+)